MSPPRKWTECPCHGCSVFGHVPSSFWKISHLAPPGPMMIFDCGGVYGFSGGGGGGGGSSVEPPSAGDEQPSSPFSAEQPSDYTVAPKCHSRACASQSGGLPVRREVWTTWAGAPSEFAVSQSSKTSHLTPPALTYFPQP